MKTENVRTRSFLAILRKLPISAKLQFLMVFFVCIFAAMLGLVVTSSDFTSGARAFVQGEGSWSKAQKQAAIELLDYAASHDEKDYREFQNSLSVPLGDRIAREELERAKPDLARVEAGFLQGRNAKEDIPKMISLFRRFRKTREINDAAQIWAQGDVYIEELQKEGAQLHELLNQAQPDGRAINAMVRQIEASDEALTPLEDRFSVTLSAGARRVEKLLAIGLPLASCLLLALGITVSWVVVRQVEANVSDRERAENAARESELRYRELLENANDMIYVHDLEGFFVSWNRKAEEMTGHRMGDGTRLHLQDVVAPEDHSLVSEMLARKLQGQNASPYSLRVISKNGSRYEVEVSSRLLYKNGEAVGVQGIARDLTERRRLEAELLQAQKMEAVGRLAGGIAHDFNNIMMIVRGYSDILMEKLHEKDPLQSHAAQIIKAVNRAADLTQRLLGFSRKQVFEPKILNVNGLVSEIAKMLPRLLGAHVDFSVELGPSAGNVNADPIQLEQVLMNLAVNSRDAMPRAENSSSAPPLGSWPTPRTAIIWT